MPIFEPFAVRGSLSYFMRGFKKGDILMFNKSKIVFCVLLLLLAIYFGREIFRAFDYDPFVFMKISVINWMIFSLAVFFLGVLVGVINKHKFVEWVLILWSLIHIGICFLLLLSNLLSDRSLLINPPIIFAGEILSIGYGAMRLLKLKGYKDRLLKFSIVFSVVVNMGIIVYLFSFFIKEAGKITLIN